MFVSSSYNFLLLCSFCCYCEKAAANSNSEEIIEILSETSAESVEGILANFTEGEEDDLSNLRFVNLVWRGGLHNGEDKGQPYKNFDLPFPEAKGHLTKRGKRQMHQIGKFFRKRYGPILNYTYDPFAVRFLAGDKNRSIDSGLMVTSGMFPPREQYEVWNPKLIWQPIAVHVDLRMSVTGGTTTVFEGECPNLDFVMQTDQYQSLKEKWAELIGYLCFSADTVEKSLPHAFIVAKTLDILSYYNETANNTEDTVMPEWANATVIKKAQEFFWDVQDFLVSFKEVNVIAGGYILDHMIGEMKDVVRRNTTRRIHGFSSALLWHGTDEKAIRLAIDHCEEPCTLEKFEKRSTTFMSDDYMSLCGLASAETLEDALSSTAGWLFFGCVVSLVLCLSALFCCLRTRSETRKITQERRPLLTNSQ